MEFSRRDFLLTGSMGLISSIFGFKTVEKISENVSMVDTGKVIIPAIEVKLKTLSVETEAVNLKIGDFTTPIRPVQYIESSGSGNAKWVENRISGWRIVGSFNLAPMPSEFTNKIFDHFIKNKIVGFSFSGDSRVYVGTGYIRKLEIGHEFIGSPIIVGEMVSNGTLKIFYDH